MSPRSQEAYNLLHRGAVALSEVEGNGIKIDLPYLDAEIKRSEIRIKEIEEELKSQDEYKIQRKRFGLQTNLTSRKQLEYVFFDVQKHERTAKMDKIAFAKIGTPYAKRFIELEEERKLHSTYLTGVRREVSHDGRLRPFFNLNTAKTFRSSSDNPNFQNLPVRSGAQAKAIRTAFVPSSEDYLLVEIDYGALEFRGAACFWKDPGMVAYASDPTLDIHRDCAAEIFLCERSEVQKKTRYCGKNMLVFPLLYGDYWGNCARANWEAIDKFDLEVNGVPMKTHLKSKGITHLGDPKHAASGSFYGHLKTVQETFEGWFPEYAEKKEQWWKDYCRNGYFDIMTGFRLAGVFSRNFILNTPVQGPSFHLLLWSLTEMVKWTKQNRMKSMVIGQIHDSLVSDVHKSEKDDFLAKAREVMTEGVRKHWDWIVTPLEIEVEIAEKNWFEKVAIK